jgi:hypothetical protein
MTEDLRQRIVARVMAQVSRSSQRRAEALAEYIELTSGVDRHKAGRVAELVPPIEDSLYEKWAVAFAERLTETIPQEQIEHLLDGSEENNAALVLVYLMFLESQRMEKQIEEDLKAYGLDHSFEPDLGQAAASYIRANIEEFKKKAKGKNEK